MTTDSGGTFYGDVDSGHRPVAGSKGRVALGMSGGVDSSTSAAVLAAEGYEVIGVTCLFHDDGRSSAAARDAAATCERLGIRHVVRDCTKAFEDRVVAPFVEAYAQGATPSPCVLCNATCKVPQLMAAADELGCDKVSTGHYARIAQLVDSGRFVVRTALDERKDQSYMLSLLTQEQLARLVLPLGGTTKLAVRVMAEDLRLPVADKPESQDICFVEGDHVDFLLDRGIEENPGPIVDEDGTVLGRHQGLFRYTIGQRKGVGVGGAAEPYYVVDKRAETNELVVGFKSRALITGVKVRSVNWQAFDRLKEPLSCMVKLRYRSRPCACTVEPEEDGGVRARLASPQPTTAPGQYAVFYTASTVLGGGLISAIER